jgi:hypothetical protein
LKGFSAKDKYATASLMAEDACLHLAILTHDLKEKGGKAQLSEEAMVKLSVLHDLSEELSKAVTGK